MLALPLVHVSLQNEFIYAFILLYLVAMCVDSDNNMLTPTSSTCSKTPCQKECRRYNVVMGDDPNMDNIAVDHTVGLIHETYFKKLYHNSCCSFARN